MEIKKITPRRDGKFMVAVWYAWGSQGDGVARRYVWTGDQLKQEQEQEQREREQADAYRKAKAEGATRSGYGGMPES